MQVIILTKTVSTKLVTAYPIILLLYFLVIVMFQCFYQELVWCSCMHIISLLLTNVLYTMQRLTDRVWACPIVNQFVSFDFAPKVVLGARNYNCVLHFFVYMICRSMYVQVLYISVCILNSYYKFAIGWACTILYKEGKQLAIFITQVEPLPPK